MAGCMYDVVCGMVLDGIVMYMVTGVYVFNCWRVCLNGFGHEDVKGALRVRRFIPFREVFLGYGPKAVLWQLG